MEAPLENRFTIGGRERGKKTIENMLYMMMTLCEMCKRQRPFACRNNDIGWGERTHMQYSHKPTQFLLLHLLVATKNCKD